MKKHKNITQIIFMLILIFLITMIVSADGVQPESSYQTTSESNNIINLQAHSNTGTYKSPIFKIDKNFKGNTLLISVKNDYIIGVNIQLFKYNGIFSGYTYAGTPLSIDGNQNDHFEYFSPFIDDQKYTISIFSQSGPSVYGHLTVDSYTKFLRLDSLHEIFSMALQETIYIKNCFHINLLNEMFFAGFNEIFDIKSDIYSQIAE